VIHVTVITFFRFELYTRMFIQLCFIIEYVVNDTEENHPLFLMLLLIAVYLNCQ